MKKREMTTADFGVILAVGISLSAFIYLCWSYILLPAPKNEFCWFEIKYLHVSGQQLTKKAFCDCDGFYHWHEGSRYKIEMEIPFVNGESVKIQGATDVLSVQKIKE